MRESTPAIAPGILSRMKAALPVVLVAAILVCGCAAKKTKSADQYFADANREYREGAYGIAVENYRELLDQHPFSDEAEESELRIAHAHYLGEDYTAAIVALSDFQRRHPTSEHLPLVGYLLDMSYVRQMGTVDRDQTAAQSAHSYFSTLIHQYPASPYADLARLELAACRTSLAEHELYIANFYAHRDNLTAEEIRLLSLTSRYGETSPAAEALYRLAKRYNDRDESEKATLALRALETLHPQATQTQRAKKLIADGGVDVPPSSDPLDLLLIANGRRRESTTFDLPRPPTELSKSKPGFGGGGMAPTDPFGRGAAF